MPGLIQSLVPPGVIAVEIEDNGQALALDPAEEALMAKAADKRRRDFALGRACAHAGLARLGVPRAPLLPGADGVPAWPDGVAGSITHTGGYAAALVAWQRDFPHLGIDAERIGGVTARLMPRLFDAEERRWLGELTGEALAQAATLLFSAKEAWFKARRASPVLSFLDIHVAVGEDGFLVAQPGLGEASGRFAIRDGLVVTAVCLAAR